MCGRRYERKPLDLWAHIVTIKVRLRWYLHRSKALDTRQGDSAIPRLGVIEEWTNDRGGRVGSKVAAAVGVTVQADRSVRWGNEGSRTG